MSAFGLPDQPEPPPVEPACWYCRRYESTGHDPACWAVLVVALDEETFQREREVRWPPAR